MTKKDEPIVIDMPKFKKVITKAGIDDKTINNDLKDRQIIERADLNGEFYASGPNIIYCVYKIEGGLENKDAVLVLFKISLPGPIPGSSGASDLVMELVRILETQFTGIRIVSFNRELSKNKKNVGLLRVNILTNKDEDDGF
jgi:hypothetical protein